MITDKTIPCFETLRAGALREFRAGDYTKSAALYSAAYQEADRRGEARYAVRFLNGLAGSYFYLYQYTRAMETYLKAKSLAEALKDREASANLSLNISSLYLQEGDVPAAESAAEQGLRYAGEDLPRQRFHLLVQLGAARADRGDEEGAIPLFRQGVALADRQNDSAFLPVALDYLGYECLRKGNLEEAGDALMRAYQIRKSLGRKDLNLSYLYLGMLRESQRDLEGAEGFLDLAESATQKGSSPIPFRMVYTLRARVREARGRRMEALADLRRALEWSRRLRLQVLPADSVRIGAEGRLAETYSRFIELGSRMAVETGDVTLARETFEAAEENRSASLRALLGEWQETRERLPEQYWETLAKSHEAEVSLLRSNSLQARREIRELEAQLTLMETQAGLALSSGDAPPRARDRSAGRLAQLQGNLGPSEAYLGFHLGDSQSYLWAVSRDSFSLYPLPSRRSLQGELGQFETAVREQRPEAARLGRQVYDRLFDQVSSRFLTKTHWMLGLDDVLFELPFAALVTRMDGEDPRYLIERQSLEIVPGAPFHLQRENERLQGPFVGIGDAVYNAADGRSSAPQSSHWVNVRKWLSRLRFFSSPSATAAQRFELPRLPGSAREIAACSREWANSQAQTIVLTGAGARRERLEEALCRRPSVLHFATHIVPSPSPGGHGLIALSIQPGGEMEFISPRNLAGLRPASPPGLVVLSGCSSGAADVLPGAGLMGMTRAWLAAGAGAVAASHWPTPDDSGELFVAFYRHLRQAGTKSNGLDPAASLRQAQLDMLRSGTWRSSPRYWAAYFLIGKS